MQLGLKTVRLCFLIKFEMFVYVRLCIIIIILFGALTASQRQTAETKSRDGISGKHVQGLFCYHSVFW